MYMCIMVFDLVKNISSFNLLGNIDIIFRCVKFLRFWVLEGNCFKAFWNFFISHFASCWMWLQRNFFVSFREKLDDWFIHFYPAARPTIIKIEEWWDRVIAPYVIKMCDKMDVIVVGKLKLKPTAYYLIEYFEGSIIWWCSAQAIIAWSIYFLIWLGVLEVLLQWYIYPARIWYEWEEERLEKIKKERKKPNPAYLVYRDKIKAKIRMQSRFKTGAQWRLWILKSWLWTFNLILWLSSLFVGFM